MEDDNRYLGFDAHRDTISVEVLDSNGKTLLKRVIPTAAKAVVELIGLLRGKLHVAVEEGTAAEWLYGLLQPLVAQVIVADTRKLERGQGDKSDRIDAHELADLLRCGRLSAVYHQDCGLRALKELAHTYLTLTKDQSRVMSRIKALYRGWGIACVGTSCYSARQRASWLEKLPEPAVQQRAVIYYQQLESLQALRQQVRQQLLREGSRHVAFRRLRQIPYVGPIWAVLLMVFIQTPHRFRTKRQLWKYAGLGVQTWESGEYCFRGDHLQRKRRAPRIRGLNRNRHARLKYVLKSVATRACAGRGPLHDFAQTLLNQGMRVEMARLTVARKIAAIALMLWKKGVDFDPRYLKSQAA